MLGYLFSGYLAESGKANPPYCHKEVPTEFDDCCDNGGTCGGETWREIDTCCGVDSLTCSGVEWNLSSCCKPFDCPGGCWYCKWKYAIFLQVRQMLDRSDSSIADEHRSLTNFFSSQVCLLTPLCIACIFVPKRYFITNKIVPPATFTSKDGETTDVNSPPLDPRERADSLWVYIEGGKNASNISIWKQVRILWRSRVFVWTSLGLSALYFVVAGIQFWITQYIVEVLQVRPERPKVASVGSELPHVTIYTINQPTLLVGSLLAFRFSPPRSPTGTPSVPSQ